MWLVEVFAVTLVVGTVLGLGWRVAEDWLEKRKG
jgi:hypothetical protein